MVKLHLQKLMEKSIILIFRYVGEFKDDKIEGKGCYIRANGDRYDGEWKNDKINGFGISNSN